MIKTGRLTPSDATEMSSRWHQKGWPQTRDKASQQELRRVVEARAVSIVIAEAVRDNSYIPSEELDSSYDKMLLNITGKYIYVEDISSRKAKSSGVTSKSTNTKTQINKRTNTGNSKRLSTESLGTGTYIDWYRRL